MLTVTNNLQNLICRHLQSVSANLGSQPLSLSCGLGPGDQLTVGPGQYCQPPAQPTCSGAQ